MRNVILMLVLGAVAIASWIYGRPGPVPALRHASGDDRPLGYYLRGARLLGPDENGHVAYRLRADRLEEDADQGGLLFERLQIEYEPANDVPWVITAGKGSAPKDRSRFDLDGGVALRSAPTDGSAPTRISNESLTFEPDSSVVTSDQRTELQIGDWHLSGVGLNAHLKDGPLKLESDVHGKFAR